MDTQTELIQPGWSVYAADGKEVGTVVGLDGEILRIKHHWLFGDKEWKVPRSAVTSVETGRVDLSLSENEVKQQQQ